MVWLHNLLRTLLFCPFHTDKLHTSSLQNRTAFRRSRERKDGRNGIVCQKTLYRPPCERFLHSSEEARGGKVFRTHASIDILYRRVNDFQGIEPLLHLTRVFCWQAVEAHPRAKLVSAVVTPKSNAVRHSLFTKLSHMATNYVL